MARTDHHSAYAFLIYYIIWILWKGSFIIDGEHRYIVLLIVILGAFPDFDAIYWLIKKRGSGGAIDTEFQHHLYFWTHWPISYIPLIIIFIVSLIFDFFPEYFFPEYFLVPVVGIFGHLLFDSISCGDGIMWGKIPWKKDRYARFVNLFPGNCDGYHGFYWEARYRHSFISKIGNIAVVASLIIITLFQINASVAHFQAENPPGISVYYVVPIVYFIITLRIGTKTLPEKAKEEPPEGRYADYRVNPAYINGLSEKNLKRHLEKYGALLEEKGVLKNLSKKK